MKSQSVFVTDNLKLAMSLTAAGFEILHGERVIKENRPLIICELAQHHNGVAAIDLQAAFKNEGDLPSQINAIIELRGITQEEYVLLAFDAARAGLHNRSTVLFAINNNQPLIHKWIGEQRSLIYRQGTPKEALRKLIDNA